MRRNFVVGVILILGGISFLFMGVLIPRLTDHKVDWRSEYETVPIGVTVLAFVLVVLGLGLVAVEVATGGLVYTVSRKGERE